VITLRIEHRVHAFDEWKATFDRDPLDRKASGVRRYRIARATDDPSHVVVDLDFDNRAEAEAMTAALRRLWAMPVAQGALAGAATTRLVETVEDRRLGVE
jgi:hypothetical protein